MRVLRHEIARQLPKGGKGRIGQTDAPVRTEHGDAFGKVVERFALHPHRRPVAAFQVDLLGQILEGPGDAAIGLGLATTRMVRPSAAGGAYSIGLAPATARNGPFKGVARSRAGSASAVAAAMSKMRLAAPPDDGSPVDSTSLNVFAFLFTEHHLGFAMSEWFAVTEALDIAYEPVSWTSDLPHLSNTSEVARRAAQVYSQGTSTNSVDRQELLTWGAPFVLFHVPAGSAAVERICQRSISIKEAWELWGEGPTLAAAAPTPGGVGAIEAALVTVPTSVGVESGQAIPVVVVFRVVTYWLPIVPAYAALTHLRRTGVV